MFVKLSEGDIYTQENGEPKSQIRPEDSACGYQCQAMCSAPMGDRSADRTAAYLWNQPPAI